MMNKACPNANDIRWKKLEKQCGYNLAMTTWLAYGQKFPEVKSLSDLHKEIKLPKTIFLDNLPKYYKAVRQYNKFNNTAHSFSIKQIGESAKAIVELHPNYLPVNIEKQRQSDYQRHENPSQTIAFKEVYAPVRTTDPSREEFLDDEYLAEQERKEFDYDPEIRQRSEYLSHLEQRQKLLESQYAATVAEKDFARQNKLVDMLKAIEKRIKEVKSDISIVNVIEGWQKDRNYINSVLTSDEVSAGEIYLALQMLDFYSSQELMLDLVSDIDIETNAPIVQRVDGIVGEANRTIEKVNALSYNFLKLKLESITGKTFSEQELKEITEIDVASALFRDISTNKNALVQLMDRYITEAGYKTQKSLNDKFKKIEELVEKIKKISPDFDIFLQKDSNGEYTGRMVDPFAQKFFNERSSAYRKFNKSKTLPSYKKLQEWKTKNTIEFDWRKLYYDQYKRFGGAETFSQSEIDDYINEIKSLLGDVEYENIFKQLSRKKNEFLARREAIEQDIELGLKTNSYLQLWDLENNPFHYFDNHDEATEIDGEVVHFNWYQNKGYIYSIPKKTINGKDTGFYDQAYSRIQNDDNLLEFYNFFTQTIDEMLAYLPDHITKDIQGKSNFIPFLKKTVFQNIMANNGTNAFKDIYNGIIEGLRAGEESTVSYDQRDPITGKPIPSLRVGMLTENLNASDIVKIIQTLENEGLKPGDDKYALRRHELERDILNEKRSFDLGNVLKAFVSVVETYRHKAAVEDSVKLINTTIRKGVEIQKTSSDNIVTDKDGNVVVTKDTFKNVISQAEYAFNVFYGKSKNIKPSKKKILNAEETKQAEYLKAKMKEIEESNLPEEEKEQEYNKYANLLEALGGNLVQSEIWDALMKYIHIKSIGWNAFSAINNLGVGTISNLIYAQGNQEFGNKEYFAGMRMMLSTVLKSATVDTISLGQSEKIRNMMESYSVLGSVADELNQSNFYKSRVGKGLNKLMPYEWSKAGEYLNQGAVFVAMMLKEKYVTPTGEEINLWDAYDKDGNFKYGEDEEIFLKFKGKLTQTIKAIHGNYDPLSKVKIKETVGGRALMMFRNWIAETVANRFETERYDQKLGRYTKGRYRSYTVAFNDPKFKDSSMIDKTLFMFSTLVSKSAREKLSELDAANMRKNAMEIYIWSAIAVLLTGLSGDDDDDEKRTAMQNYILNIGFRLQTDLEFYSSPIAAEKLIRQTVPPAQLVVDVWKFKDAVVKYTQGEDEIPTGPYAHESRLARASGKLIPGWATYYRQEAATKQLQK